MNLKHFANEESGIFSRSGFHFMIRMAGQV